MLRLTVIVVLLLLVLSSTALAADWIYVYENGWPVGYSVGDGFAYQHVPPEQIDADNEALLGSVLGYGPWRADVGYGATEYNNTVDAAEHYGRRRGGPFLQDLFIRDYLSPGDWRGVFGDYYDPGACYAELDKSGPHWSIDVTGFSRWGWVYGLDNLDERIRTERRRRQGEFTWRRGSMDGGVWRLSGQAYELNVDRVSPQADDGKHKRGDVGFRSVESKYTAEGSAYYGQYTSDSASMNNSYIGAKLDTSVWLSPKLLANADLDFRSIDADYQQGTVNRGQGGASLEWLLENDTTLITRVQRVQEDSDIAIGSQLEGCTEYGGQLLYHPGPGIWISADYARRETDIERLGIETPEVGGLLGGSPLDYQALAQYRSSESADSNRLELRGKCRLKRRLFLSGAYMLEDFTKLPQSGLLGSSSAEFPYFSDENTSGDLRLRYDLGGGANVQLSGNTERRTNSILDTTYKLRRFAGGYSGPLTGKLRWALGISRHETSVDLANPTSGFSAASWNYDISMASHGDFADYRVTWARQVTDAAPGGDYHGVGLEMTMADMPVSLSAWYRKRKESLGGYSDYEDSGITLAYHIELQ